MEEMTHEQYEKWRAVKTALERAGKTDSVFYEEAMNRLRRRPSAPYSKADAQITPRDVF